MNRIKELDARLDAACQKMFPRVASRLAWLDVPTFTGFSRGTNILLVLGLVLLALVTVLMEVAK